jgi:phage terminase small subunit
VPRKSANERMMQGVVAPDPLGHERPDPPADMPEAAATIWRGVVASMRPRHFTRETHEQLARYCAAMVECARLEAALVGVDDVTSTVYERVAKQLATTAGRALGYARALRIAPISNRENLNKLDARDPGRSLHRKPWELDDDGARRRKPWEA